VFDGKDMSVPGSIDKETIPGKRTGSAEVGKSASNRMITNHGRILLELLCSWLAGLVVSPTEVFSFWMVVDCLWFLRHIRCFSLDYQKEVEQLELYTLTELCLLFQ
jgi:hypothetical protein